MEIYKKMSKIKKNKAKNNGFGGGQFFAMPTQVLRSVAYISVSSHAIRLLYDLGNQYNGKNNGDLSASFKVMKRDRGWKSSGTLSRAAKELIKYGLIIKSRQGGRNQCNLYALSFLKIHYCEGKLDIEPTEKAYNNWKEYEPKLTPIVPDLKASQAKVKAEKANEILKSIVEYQKAYIN